MDTYLRLEFHDYRIDGCIPTFGKLLETPLKMVLISLNDIKCINDLCLYIFDFVPKLGVIFYN